MTRRFAKTRFDATAAIFTGATAASTLLILGILATILLYLFWRGGSQISWQFVTGGTETDMFDPSKAGILPMIIGTAARVLLMTLFVIPIGVTTAVYLTEYARTTAPLTRFIRGAVNNLAGVPSIVFGLFGVGFFISFLGGSIDGLTGTSEPRWGKPALLWASMTLAVMTLPVVIVATEEALKAIAPGLREASLALGATKLETIWKIVVPNALPGILTGAILAISRAAGEVAPILFTGAAYFLKDTPKALNDQFMDLAYHVYVLSTQSPNVDLTRPILFGTVVVLLALTFSLNLVAVLVRAKIRRQMRAAH
ncbi:MAG: phosphate ABC transporter permease PstA [Verrucomicrobiales bacterium]|nr:phosphate ABC transporter permease PstA [Verrucomicrobiales bacterium]